MRIRLPFLFSIILFAAIIKYPIAAERVSSNLPSNSVPEQPELLKAAHSPEWISLCHYKKTIFGSYKSQIDGMNFFLDKDGSENPEAELLTTIRIFLAEQANGNDDIRTRFPARVRFIREKLHIPIQDSNNDALEKFILKMKSE